MAFCEVIAIYREPIYLQFASGREGAAGGGRELGVGERSGRAFGCLLSADRSLSCSSSAAEGDHLLTWQGLGVHFVQPGSGCGELCMCQPLSGLCGARRDLPRDILVQGYVLRGNLLGIPLVPISDPHKADGGQKCCLL